MLHLSRCPGEGEVSPFQPSDPLGVLAASSGGPPLGRLETIQSGAVEVPVVHEQTPRQPLVPCSREALEPQSQQRTCGLQAALIPCRRQPPLRWSSGHKASARGGEPGPHPSEGRNQDALGVSQNSAAETKILLATGPVLPRPIDGGAGPSSRGSRPRCSGLTGRRAPAATESRGPGTAAAQRRAAPHAAWAIGVSRACARLPASAQASFLVPPARTLLCPSPLLRGPPSCRLAVGSCWQ